MTEQWQDGLRHATERVSHLIHLIQDKPVVVTLSAAMSVLVSDWANQTVMLGALCLLWFADLITKIWVCRRTGQPVTSALMRQRGFPKLRDYLILCICAWMTTPIMGAMVFRSILSMMAFWELWSIAENLNDGGYIPFDIRNSSIFDGIRKLARKKEPRG